MDLPCRGRSAAYFQAAGAEATAGGRTTSSAPPADTAPFIFAPLMKSFVALAPAAGRRSDEDGALAAGLEAVEDVEEWREAGHSTAGGGSCCYAAACSCSEA